jgi:hypothetical protein
LLLDAWLEMALETALETAMATASLLVTLAGWWGWLGLAVAVPFLGYGIDRIDPNARGAYVFRPLLLPGVVLLWPLVLWRWYLLETDQDRWELRHRPPKRAHGGVWLVLAFLLPAIVAGALLLRQPWPEGRAPAPLDPVADAVAGGGR